MKKYQPLLVLFSCIAVVSPEMVSGAAVSALPDGVPAQSTSVAEPGRGGGEQQTIPDNIPGGQSDNERPADSSGNRRTHYGVGYEFRMKRLERVERPQRPERVHRPMRPNRPGR